MPYDMTISSQAVDEETRKWKVKCKYADKYKAMREPKCGCVECWIKWECSHD